MQFTYTWLDVAFITSTLAVIFLAFSRGFLKEIFLLVNWIAAIVACYMITPTLALLFGEAASKNIIVLFILGSFVFITVFIVVSILTSKVRYSLLGSFASGALDKTIGIFYGLLKSLAIFGILYSLASTTFQIIQNTDRDNVIMPPPIKNAFFHATIKGVSDIVDPFVQKVIKTPKQRIIEFRSDPKNFDKVKESVTEKTRNKLTESRKETDKMINRSTGTGYDKDDIEEKDKLMDTIKDTVNSITQ